MDLKNLREDIKGVTDSITQKAKNIDIDEIKQGLKETASKIDFKKLENVDYGTWFTRLIRSVVMVVAACAAVCAVLMALGLFLGMASCVLVVLLAAFVLQPREMKSIAADLSGRMQEWLLRIEALVREMFALIREIAVGLHGDNQQERGQAKEKESDDGRKESEEACGSDEAGEGDAETAADKKTKQTVRKDKNGSQGKEPATVADTPAKAEAESNKNQEEANGTAKSSHADSKKTPDEGSAEEKKPV